MIVAGVDGTKGGWVAVVLDGGRFARTELVREVASRFDRLADASVVAIDVPIGFGPREADALARKALRGAASSVFTTPSRETLMRKFGPGLGVSAQAHALGPRIIAVTDRAARDTRLREVHPELSFREMNGGTALRHRKKSAGGVFQRLDLLRAHGIELDVLGEAAVVPIDDLLDAAACAWTAGRIATGIAYSLPDPPETIDGRPVAIWC